MSCFSSKYFPEVLFCCKNIKPESAYNLVSAFRLLECYLPQKMPKIFCLIVAVALFCISSEAVPVNVTTDASTEPAQLFCELGDPCGWVAPNLLNKKLDFFIKNT